VSRIELLHIAEPRLRFGYNQAMCDPRDGLTLFGPFTNEKIKKQVDIGIVGPKGPRAATKKYLERIASPIFYKGREVARPFFPGLEATFGLFINPQSIKELDVSSDEINACFKYTDPNVRVFNLANLFEERLVRYSKEEEFPIAVWFVAIPDQVYLYGRPKSRIPKAADNVRLGLSRKDRHSEQLFLFKEEQRIREAYDFQVNFHNQLKARLLKHKIVIQIIRESTIAYRDLWEDTKRIENQEKFDTAKAWNIATTLYYKVGGIPWCLADIRESVCYLGLIYKRFDFFHKNGNACCGAQMFLDSGDGMVFRGNIGDWYNPKNGEFHLKRPEAVELLTKSLEAFKQKSSTYPKEVFIHAKTYFDDEEWAGFGEASKGKSKIVGVRIREDSGFKLYRDFSFGVPRGTMFKVDEENAYLWSNGFIPRLRTQQGVETPNPLSVEITRGTEDIVTVCRDILALTKLNYNSCIFADGKPVTLRFADSIGEILTAGKEITSENLTFKYYI